MKLDIARFVGPLVVVISAGYSTAQASPAETTPGTVTPSTATMAAPVPPMSAAEAATTTPVAVAPSAPATQAPAAAAPPAAAPAASVASTPEAKSAEAETFAIRKTARELGLRPRNKAGTEVYCKSFAEIGTHLATLNCYTKEQVAELQKRTQSNQDDVATMQRASLTEPNGG
jgi:hypothetical protein